jgi:hypothetical protein
MLKTTANIQIPVITDQDHILMEQKLQFDSYSLPKFAVQK